VFAALDRLIRSIGDVFSTPAGDKKSSSNGSRIGAATGISSVALLLFLLQNVNAIQTQQAELVQQVTRLQSELAQTVRDARQRADAAEHERAALSRDITDGTKRDADISARVRELERMATDPRARPGAFTADDGAKLRDELITRQDSREQIIRAWVLSTLKSGRADDVSLRAPSPASRIEQIMAAMSRLDPSDPADYTSDGKPRTDRLRALTGTPVTADERDVAVAAARLIRTAAPAD